MRTPLGVEQCCTSPTPAIHYMPGEISVGVMVRVTQALHKGNTKLKSKLVAGFELDTVAGFHN
jgi:hypothetical protein